MGPEDQRAVSADTLLSFFALQPASPGLWTHCCGQPVAGWSLFLQVMEAEQFRGAQLCQGCACSWLCASPASPAPALEFVVDSLMSQDNFQEVPWALRARRAWEVQEWVARWEWEGNKRTRSNSSPGADGLPELSPQKRLIDSWLRSGSQCIWQLHWGEPGHRSAGGFNIPLFPLTLI